MNRVLITGGTGFLGSALAKQMALSGYDVVLLSRNPARVRQLEQGIRVERWDGRTAGGWGSLVNANTAIVNLAGESIGVPPFPWTAAKKQRILHSRIDAGRAIAEAVQLAQHKPRVVIQSSGVNYYGLHEDELLTEDARPGTDFLARVAIEWENATAPVESYGVRRAIIRIGLVLSRYGGVLPYMALPFRLYAGGPIGSGMQYISWIHLADEIGAIQFLIENPSAKGTFNLAAFNSVTNAEFGRALAHALKRPYYFPIPGFAMRLVFGELAELLLLGGLRAVPRRLDQLGYQWQFTDVQTALADVYNGRSAPANMSNAVRHA